MSFSPLQSSRPDTKIYPASYIGVIVCRASEAAVIKQGGLKTSQAAEASQERCRRLEILIALRKMYRNVLRAQGLLSQPSPIYYSDVFKPGRHFGMLQIAC